MSVRNDEQRADRYKKLSARLGPEKARTVIDELQVLALTRPDTLREFETFLDRQQDSATPHEANKRSEKIR